MINFKQILNSKLKSFIEILREANKERFIIKNTVLSQEQKEDIIWFMSNNPSFENLISKDISNGNWKEIEKWDYSKFGEYKEKVLNSKNKFKKSLKLEKEWDYLPEDLFQIIFKDENKVCAILKNHKAGVYSNSTACNNQEAKWCIGYTKSSSYWDTKSKFSIFVLILFKEPLHSNKKVMIQFKKTPLLWVPNDHTEKFENYDLSIEFFKELLNKTQLSEKNLKILSNMDKVKKYVLSKEERRKAQEILRLNDFINKLIQSDYIEIVDDYEFVRQPMVDITDYYYTLKNNKLSFDGFIRCTIDDENSENIDLPLGVNLERYTSMMDTNEEFFVDELDSEFFIILKKSKKEIINLFEKNNFIFNISSEYIIEKEKNISVTKNDICSSIMQKTFENQEIDNLIIDFSSSDFNSKLYNFKSKECEFRLFNTKINNLIIINNINNNLLEHFVLIIYYTGNSFIKNLKLNTKEYNFNEEYEEYKKPRIRIGERVEEFKDTKNNLYLFVENIDERLKDFI
jgi:hypothetical protein